VVCRACVSGSCSPDRHSYSESEASRRAARHRSSLLFRYSLLDSVGDVKNEGQFVEHFFCQGADLGRPPHLGIGNHGALPGKCSLRSHCSFPFVMGFGQGTKWNNASAMPCCRAAPLPVPGWETKD